MDFAFAHRRKVERRRVAKCEARCQLCHGKKCDFNPIISRSLALTSTIGRGICPSAAANVKVKLTTINLGCMLYTMEKFPSPFSRFALTFVIYEFSE